MTTLLRAPGPNATPRAVVRIAPGMLALDTTCVTPACRWYTVAELCAVNDRALVAEAAKTPERIEHVIPDTDWPVAEYVAKPVPVLYVTADELGAEGIGGKNGRPAVPGVIVDQSSGVSIRVIQKPTVWHEALKAS